MGMNYLGDFPTGKTIYVYFNTFDSNDPSASATITGFALADIKIYKNGSVTQRSSTSGFTLLDTDGVDFDANTGIHGFSIDTSDNTDAGFFAAGNDYTVVVGPVTLDAATITFIAASFSIDNRGLLRPTTAQRTLDVTATGAAGVDWGNVENQATAVNLSSTTTNLVNTTTTNTDMRGTDSAATAASLATAQADLDILTGVDGATLAASQPNYAPATAAALATVDANVDAVLVDTGTTIPAVLGTPSVDLATDIASIQTDTNSIEVDTQDIQSRLPAALSSNGNITADVQEIDNDATAAANLSLAALGIVTGSAITGTLSTTQMSTDLTEATGEHYTGGIVVFIGGALAGQRTDITAYDGDTKIITMTAITEAPLNGQAFVIV